MKITLILIATLAILLSCGKSEQDNNPVDPTQVEITVPPGVPSLPNPPALATGAAYTGFKWRSGWVSWGRVWGAADTPVIGLDGEPLIGGPSALDRLIESIKGSIVTGDFVIIFDETGHVRWKNW